jgi:phenylalanyl-tRNA synthetase alpha chain
VLDQLETLAQTASSELEQLGDSEALDRWYSRYMGRKGEMTQILRQIGDLPPVERPVFGQRANQLRQKLEASYIQRATDIRAAEMDQTQARGALDVTLPGRPLRPGRLHPSSQTLRRMRQIWAEMGFQSQRTREVETDEMNFQLLNFPPNHPAREMQDTFYTTNPTVLLRTQTSPGQIRVMRDYCPEPIRVILQGMVYRNEQTDVRHEMQFNQLEGIAMGRNIRLSDLKGSLTSFAHRLYGEGRAVRFRASHFPFTEPSADLEIYWGLKTEADYRITRGTGWLEILGCGMIHPTVLRNGGYDPDKFSGFAFGIGPERVAMRLHGVEDIRLFWVNDLRFLEQF